jgi:hypothetical protein
VYDRKPVEHTLLDPALAQHREIFGLDPSELTADKGYYQSMDQLRELCPFSKPA